MAGWLKAGKLDRLVTILAKTSIQSATTGAYSSTWAEVATVFAQVVDALPSRAERVSEGVTIANRPCRVRMRWRTDITSAMRLRIDGRELRIVGGPAMLGAREGLELLAEELTTEGNDA